MNTNTTPFLYRLFRAVESLTFVFSLVIYIIIIYVVYRVGGVETIPDSGSLVIALINLAVLGIYIPLRANSIWISWLLLLAMFGISLVFLYSIIDTCTNRVNCIGWLLPIPNSTPTPEHTAIPTETATNVPTQIPSIPPPTPAPYVLDGRLVWNLEGRAFDPATDAAQQAYCRDGDFSGSYTGNYPPMGTDALGNLRYDTRQEQRVRVIGRSENRSGLLLEIDDPGKIFLNPTWSNGARSTCLFWVRLGFVRPEGATSDTEWQNQLFRLLMVDCREMFCNSQ
jgi:hypothetical protein